MAEGDGQEVAWIAEFADTIRRWHNRIIEESGGAHGEHTARLLACCARPFQTAFGEHIYPKAIEQAAALFHALVTSHPFADGNKRTATVASTMFLAARGILPDGPSDLQLRLIGELAVYTASEKTDVAIVAYWLRRILDSQTDD